MQTLWNVLTIVLILNILALCVAGAVLHKGGYITEDRVDRALAIFEVPYWEEDAKVAIAQKQAEEAAEKARMEAALKRAQSGPKSFGDELAMQKATDELAQLRADRVNAEIRRLQDRLKQERNWIEARVKDLESREKLLKEELEREANKREDLDFKLAVQMYENLKSDQAKALMVKLIDQGQVDQVVDYLSNMETRKSAGILKEFKSPAEIQTASDLIERMRTRGERLMPQLEEKARPLSGEGSGTELAEQPAGANDANANQGEQQVKRGSAIRIPGVLPRYSWYRPKPRAA